ncbi:MAG: hypothetical protein AB1435_05540 [Chloroflexota bacterium]
MSGGIFVIQDDGQFVELAEQGYDSEDLLQGLLESYPNLLAGDQIDPIRPRRWLLVSREVGMSSDEVDVGRIDHLFLDQDGVPTLVEVKRSSDTRIRREVVGQMLDYAANAVVHWPVERIRAHYETRCETMNLVPEEELQALIGLEADPDQFWNQVQDHLRIGRIRLIFVADVIPTELRRIVEFLNQQMSPAEVLAVEIRQYVGQGLRSLVPRVVGQTVEAQQKKSGSATPKRQWDEASYFAELQQKFSLTEVDMVRRLLDWARPRTTQIWWGKGKENGSFVPVLNHNGTDHQLFAVFTAGGVEIYFQWYQYKAPFDSEEKRLELLKRLNAIQGVSIPESAIARRPSIPFSTLAKNDALQQFLTVFEWMIGEIRAS